jgi:hypothetical protein
MGIESKTIVIGTMANGMTFDKWEGSPANMG